jgi:Nucleotidyl transferase of unknown function (DUF2204)
VEFLNSRFQLLLGYATYSRKSTSNRVVPEQQNNPLPSPPQTSSEPPLIAKEQESLYREVLEVLNEKQVPYAVSGAFALREHTGICRYTKDLDVFLSAHDVPTALDGLKAHGFETEITDPVWLAKARRDDYFVDLITGMSNAVILVDQSWIDRALPAEIMGVPTKVLAPEELVASKLFVTRRERFDGADIAHVIYGTRGAIDWKRVLSLVGEHWEVLLWTLMLYRYVYPAQTNYVPSWLWNDLLNRFALELENHNPKARFRGSLIDENMFSIDMNEWGLDNILDEYRGRRMREGEVRLERKAS